MALTFDAKAFPKGFRIRNTPVALSFCHDGSFVPVYARSDFSFIAEGGQQLVYWDDSAYVTQWVPANAKDVVAQSQQMVQRPPNANDAEIDAFFSSLESEAPQLSKPPAPGQQASAPQPSASAAVLTSTADDKPKGTPAGKMAFLWRR